MLIRRPGTRSTVSKYFINELFRCACANYLDVIDTVPSRPPPTLPRRSPTGSAGPRREAWGEDGPRVRPQ